MAPKNSVLFSISLCVVMFLHFVVYFVNRTLACLFNQQDPARGMFKGTLPVILILTYLFICRPHYFTRLARALVSAELTAQLIYLGASLNLNCILLCDVIPPLEDTMLGNISLFSILLVATGIYVIYRTGCRLECRFLPKCCGCDPCDGSSDAPSCGKMACSQPSCSPALCVNEPPCRSSSRDSSCGSGTMFNLFRTSGNCSYSEPSTSNDVTRSRAM